jgi:hypothetical protein
MASGLKIVWPIPDPISELRAERPAFGQTIVREGKKRGFAVAARRAKFRAGGRLSVASVG